MTTLAPRIRPNSLPCSTLIVANAVVLGILASGQTIRVKAITTITGARPHAPQATDHIQTKLTVLCASSWPYIQGFYHALNIPFCSSDVAGCPQAYSNLVFAPRFHGEE